MWWARTLKSPVCGDLLSAHPSSSLSLDRILNPDLTKPRVQKAARCKELRRKKSIDPFFTLQLRQIACTNCRRVESFYITITDQWRWWNGVTTHPSWSDCTSSRQLTPQAAWSSYIDGCCGGWWSHPTPTPQNTKPAPLYKLDDDLYHHLASP